MITFFVLAAIFQQYIQKNPKIILRNEHSKDVCGKRTTQIDPKSNVSFAIMPDLKRVT